MPEGKHILSVSYDDSLLQTRQILLERQGYRVTSVLGFKKSANECGNGGFDLFILGHSIPKPDKEKLIDAFHAACHSPVLLLLRRDEGVSPSADYYAYPDNPEDLLGMVIRILPNHR